MSESLAAIQFIEPDKISRKRMVEYGMVTPQPGMIATFGGRRLAKAGRLRLPVSARYTSSWHHRADWPSHGKPAIGIMTGHSPAYAAISLSRIRSWHGLKYAGLHRLQGPAPWQ